MKYAQMVMGLLIGTALGGTVIAATGNNVSAGAGASLDKEAIKQIVRDTITQEPKLILDSVQKYQDDQHKQEMQTASD